MAETSQSYLPDLVAGLSIAGLLLPEAVAYSSIGNMPPQAGVIALFAGIIAYGLIGKSRFAIVSATSSSAALSAAVITSMMPGDAVHRLTLAMGLIGLTGVFFVIAGLAKLGSVSDFIAKPVLRGFAFGLALVIVLKQLAKMVDLHPKTSNIVMFGYDLFSHLPQWNLAGLATGAAALALLFLLSPFKRLPGALVVIVLGVMAGQVLQLAHHGVAEVGHISLSLAVPTVPNLAREEWTRLGELAFALVLVLYAESYSAIRTFALKHNDPVDTNRDLIALGVANMASAMFQGLPVGAGYSGTSANDAAGAQSKLSSWVAVGVILLIVLTLLPYLALTPEPVLAAIVIHAVSHTLNPAVFKPYMLWQRDRLVVAVAIAAVLLLGIMDGLLLAIAVSLMMTLKRQSDSKLSVLGRLGSSHDFVPLADYTDAHAVAGVLVLRPEAPLFFANVDSLLAAARAEIAHVGSGIQRVVLSLEESPDLDSACIEALRDFAVDVQNKGLVLRLARLKQAAKQVLILADIEALPATVMSSLSVSDAVQ